MSVMFNMHNIIDYTVWSTPCSFLLYYSDHMMNPKGTKSQLYDDTVAICKTAMHITG